MGFVSVMEDSGDVKYQIVRNAPYPTAIARVMEEVLVVHSSHVIVALFEEGTASSIKWRYKNEHQHFDLCRRSLHFTATQFQSIKKFLWAILIQLQSLEWVRMCVKWTLRNIHPRSLSIHSCWRPISTRTHLTQSCSSHADVKSADVLASQNYSRDVFYTFQKFHSQNLIEVCYVQRDNRTHSRDTVQMWDQNSANFYIFELIKICNRA